MGPKISGSEFIHTVTGIVNSEKTDDHQIKQITDLFNSSLSIKFSWPELRDLRMLCSRILESLPPDSEFIRLFNKRAPIDGQVHLGAVEVADLAQTGKKIGPGETIGGRQSDSPPGLGSFADILDEPRRSPTASLSTSSKNSSKSSSRSSTPIENPIKDTITQTKEASILLKEEIIDDLQIPYPDKQEILKTLEDAIKDFHGEYPELGASNASDEFLAKTLMLARSLHPGSAISPSNIKEALENINQTLSKETPNNFNSLEQPIKTLSQTNSALDQILKKSPEKTLDDSSSKQSLEALGGSCLSTYRKLRASDPKNPVSQVINDPFYSEPSKIKILSKMTSAFGELANKGSMVPSKKEKIANEITDAVSKITNKNTTGFPFYRKISEETKASTIEKKIEGILKNYAIE
ncbi:MAG: hypothetical protein V4489_00425 [Chlamydiota bacterium]